MTDNQVGLVELLANRIYEDENGQDVLVAPGNYPVFRDSAGSVYWVMTGRPSFPVSRRRRMVVTSGSISWNDLQRYLQTDPAFIEGHPGQRLRFAFFSESLTSWHCDERVVAP